MKILSRFFILCFIVFFSLSDVYADGSFYCVYDSESGLYQEFTSYNEAYSFYNDNIDSYQNLVLKDDSSVLKMEYGVISFNSEGCSLDTTYYSLNNKENDTINGCYGSDALYLYEDGNNVVFLMSGAVGSVSKDSISLYPYEKGMKISSYYVKDTYLYHNIKSNMEDYYSYSLKLDKDVKGLRNSKEYFSYDGHYFYDDFYLMSDDLRNDIRDNSVNYDNPYYNYFQYLSYRTVSSYSALQFESYLHDEMGFMGMLNGYSDENNDGANDIVNRSQLYDIADELIANQSINGTNALLLLASAINDSSYGKSLESYYYNNLFMNSSYNSDYQRQTRYFDSVYESLDNYAHYTINRTFANRRNSYYKGLYLGDRNGGICFNYSKDPYYGERVASICFEIDEKMGSEDRNRYSLVFMNKGSHTLYTDETLSDSLYSISNNQAVYPLVSENEGIYEIRYDNSNKEYTCDLYDSTAYINQEDISFIMYGNNDVNNTYKNVEVNFDGGIYQDKGSMSLHLLNENDTESIVPYKEGYVFTGYEKTYDEESNTWTYNALYKKIVSVNVNADFDTSIDLDSYLKFNNSFMMVSYDDGSGEAVPLSSTYISFYDNSYVHDEELTVDYNGIKSAYSISITDEKKILQENLDLYLSGNLYSEFKRRILNNGNIDLSWNDIRIADEYLLNRNRRNYVMTVPYDGADISVSGLDLSLPDKRTFSLIQDIYYLDFALIDDARKETIMNVADAYGFKEVSGLDISFRFNYEDIHMNTPIIVNISIPDKDISCVYTVYHLDQNNQVIKCKSVHSLYCVTFEAKEEGSYLILKKESFNTYDMEDYKENLKYEDTGIDEHKINIGFLLVMAIVLTNFIGIAVYYIVNTRKDEKWRDYKKLLQTPESVQEEKPKN
ncbi:MAG: hypothetical protein Q4D13_04010 [Erysipelotrichaceae bacterium]|nr:hypothetical protein [Erysipelotrichaceae bacterium]